jgi:hypothetical protein
LFVTGKAGTATPVRARALYESPNGDRWFIAHGGDGRVFIRHEPNEPSGGEPANFGILEFMAQQQGPQHEAFLSLVSQVLRAMLEGDEASFNGRA